MRELLEGNLKSLSNNERKRIKKAKKEWLEGYRLEKLQYDYYLGELQEQQERKLGLTKLLTGMPSSNVGKRQDQRWIEIMEYEDEIIDYLTLTTENILHAIQEIDQAISELPQRERTIITARYIKGKSFMDIHKEFPWSERTMYQVHDNALELLPLPPDYQLSQQKVS